MSGFGLGSIEYEPDDALVEEDSLTWPDFDWTPRDGDSETDPTPPPPPSPNDPPTSDNGTLPPPTDAPSSNLVVGGSFETVGSWRVGAGWTVPYTSNDAMHGAAVARCVAAANGVGAALGLGTTIPVDINQPYWASAWGWMMSWTSGSGRMLLHEIGSNGLFLNTTVVGEWSGLTNGWKRVSKQFAPRGATAADVVWNPATLMVAIEFDTASGPVFDLRLDGASFTKGALLGSFAPSSSETVLAGSIEGTIPRTALDTTPPAVPNGLSAFSDTVLKDAGTPIVRLVAGLEHPTDSDYVGSEVEMTSSFVPHPTDSEQDTPVWNGVYRTFMAANDTQATFAPLSGGTKTWVRARSVDATGNRSAWSTPIATYTVRDTVAPDMVTGLAVTPGYRMLGVRWNAVAAPDLAHYEIRYAPASGGAPNNDLWVPVTTRGTMLVIKDLAPSTTYYVQARAVDTSGNVRTSASDSTAVLALNNANAGWSNTAGSYMTGVPTLIGAADVSFNSVVTQLLSAGTINADNIQAGTLTISGQQATADLLVVKNSGGAELLRIDQYGLIGRDPGATNKAMRWWQGRLEFTNNYNANDPNASTWTNALSADGLVADVIKLGAAPGGHNSVPNSGFELEAFGVASTTTFTSAADWQSHIASTDINLNDAGTELKMTSYS